MPNKPKLSDTDVGRWSFDDEIWNLPDFDERCGVIVPVDETLTPFDVFSLFFTENIVKFSKKETNKYANSFVDKLRRTVKLKTNSLQGKWTAIKTHEIYLFFKIIFHMCYV